MAHLVKTKAAISVVSLTILAMMPLLESNFNAPVVIKRWDSLTWNDFKGIPKIFGRYDAAISSTVFLEYDSNRGAFRAYAGQHNVQSWARGEARESTDALRHEQYHFNITEIHARLLNDYIQENPNESEETYKRQLLSIKNTLSQIQQRYDRETEHSLIKNQQRLWEFKIDSLLNPRSGWVTDQFSGGSVFMPAKYQITRKITTNGVRIRQFEWKKYGMIFQLTSMQDENYDDSTILRLVKYFRGQEEFLKTLTIADSASRLLVTLQDTSNNTEYNCWVRSNDYLYRVGATFSKNAIDTTGYYKILQSFMDSFQIVDTDSLWIQKLEQTHGEVKNAYTFDHSAKKPQPCINTYYPDKPGFYRGPIVREDGAYILPYDYLLDADSLHHSDLLLINENRYTFTPTPDGQIFFIPGDNIPRSRFRLSFGYLLKTDSTEPCYRFHHNALMIQAASTKP